MALGPGLIYQTFDGGVPANRRHNNGIYKGIPNEARWEVPLGGPSLVETPDRSVHRVTLAALTPETTRTVFFDAARRGPYGSEQPRGQTGRLVLAPQEPFVLAPPPSPPPNLEVAAPPPSTAAVDNGARALVKNRLFLEVS